LRGVEHRPGALQVETFLPQFVEDTMQSLLDVGQGVKWRQLPITDFGMTANRERTSADVSGRGGGSNRAADCEWQGNRRGGHRA
jgi:hypothetical protein